MQNYIWSPTSQRKGTGWKISLAIKKGTLSYSNSADMAKEGNGKGSASQRWSQERAGLKDSGTILQEQSWDLSVYSAVGGPDNICPGEVQNSNGPLTSTCFPLFILF